MPVIQSENDPYEFAWPGDAKEARAAERDSARKKADINPSPRWLAAASAVLRATGLPVAVG